MDEAAFQAFAERVVPIAQENGVAAVIAGDTRIAGRVRADGIHVDGRKAQLADVIDRMQDKMMVGAGGAKTRDDALELGEARPDYMFFGRFGYDNTPAPHPRNLNARPLVGGDDRDPLHRLGWQRHRIGRGRSPQPAPSSSRLSSAVFADGDRSRQRRSPAPTRCSTRPRRVSRADLGSSVLASSLDRCWARRPCLCCPDSRQ